MDFAGIFSSYMFLISHTVLRIACCLGVIFLTLNILVIYSTNRPAKAFSCLMLPAKACDAGHAALQPAMEDPLQAHEHQAEDSN